MPFYTNAFPKQTGYVPRLSSSTASGDSGAGKTDNAAQQQNQQQPGSPTSPTGRRRVCILIHSCHRRHHCRDRARRLCCTSGSFITHNNHVPPSHPRVRSARSLLKVNANMGTKQSSPQQAATSSLASAARNAVQSTTRLENPASMR